MVDWLQWGATQQTTLRKVWAPQAITYTFTDGPLALRVISIPDATVGEYRREIPTSDLGGAIEVNVHRRDFIFETSYLKVSGYNQMPESGDVIKWAVGGRTLEFTVEQLDEGESIWYWHDKYTSEIRVHALTYDIPDGSVLH